MTPPRVPPMSFGRRRVEFALVDSAGAFTERDQAGYAAAFFVLAADRACTGPLGANEQSVRCPWALGFGPKWMLNPWKHINTLPGDRLSGMWSRKCHLWDFVGSNRLNHRRRPRVASAIGIGSNLCGNGEVVVSPIRTWPMITRSRCRKVLSLGREPWDPVARIANYFWPFSSGTRSASLS